MMRIVDETNSIIIFVTGFENVNRHSYSPSEDDDHQWSSREIIESRHWNSKENRVELIKAEEVSPRVLTISNSISKMNRHFDIFYTDLEKNETVTAMTTSDRWVFLHGQQTLQLSVKFPQKTWSILNLIFVFTTKTKMKQLRGDPSSTIYYLDVGFRSTREL